MISAPWPEISHLLLDALSQANTLGGRNGTICLNHAKTSFTSSDLTVILPSASTSCAPCPANTALIQLIASVQVLNGMPKGYPALAHFSAATKNAFHVQASASASSGGSPAGYIRVTYQVRNPIGNSAPKIAASSKFKVPLPRAMLNSVSMSKSTID